MDAAASSTPPRGSPDTVDAPLHPQLPDTAIVAERRIKETGAVGSPVRRSPRLSRPSPLRPPIDSDSTQDLDGYSDDQPESVHDVAFRPSRDETPDNDDLPPDEPSTVLASRIMRAHDNPSPPPRDLSHTDIHYAPGKDGQFPLSSVSVPASPFRPINLLEHLYQFSHPLFDPPHRPWTPTSGARPGISKSESMSPRGFISTESSPFIASVPLISTSHQDLAPADTIPSSTTQRTVHGLPSSSSQHLATTTSSLESQALSSLPQAVDSSSDVTVPSASNDYPQNPRSERRRSVSRSSPLPHNAKAPSSRLANVDSEAPGAETVPGERDSDGEVLLADNNSLPFVKGGQESKSKPTNTEVGPSLLQTSEPLPPHSTGVAAGLCLLPEPTSPIKETNSAIESIHVKQPSVTPPRTPAPVMNPDFSRTSVRRPVIAPTPVRGNNTWKLDSPAKFPLDVDNIYRTPAQRILIGTAFARGNSSSQKTGQLSAGSDQSRQALFPNIRAPVFTRPALDDPSRSPAKRIPIADLATSPTRDRQAQRFPTRLDLRARSASVESRPFGTILARSRSIEPYLATSKSDDAKVKETIFPMVTVSSRAAIKLPFPFVPDKKSGGDLPPPIPEEQESAQTGNTEADAIPRVTRGNTTSQLRKPSTSSRIPRIGNKPYARPPKTGKVTVGTTTASTIRAHTVLPFQLAGKNIMSGNAEGSSAQRTNDQRLVGSLKRKRSTEATLPNSHPVMIRQVVPGILSKKYAPNPAKLPSQVQAPSESSPPKASQPLKFRKVVDGMLSARYAPAKASCTQTELSNTSPPPSPLSEISSSSDEGSSNEKPPHSHPPAHPESGTSLPRTDADAPVVGPSTHQQSLHQDTDGHSSRPRRTCARKPAQQQYVLDVFSSNPPTRPPPARRKPPPRSEGDYFMGMSATALKALTTSNTTKNQQTVAVLATEVIRKEGLRPESPTVKVRTVLQKQRDERDMRRKERAQRRAQMSEGGLGCRDAENRTESNHLVSPGPYGDHDENDDASPQKHCRGPGDEEDYETPERPERMVEPLRLEGMGRQVKPVKQVKWQRGLSTAVYLDEVDLKPGRSIPMNIVVRSCLAHTSKNLPLDSLGNLIDLDKRPFPELVTEHIVVRRYLYDNDIEPEPIPVKATRSRSKKSRS